MMFDSFDSTFHLLSVLFAAFFVVFIVILVVILGKSISEWGKNNRSPLLTVDAQVVAKRMNVSHSSDQISGMTSYYVTFQVASGDRMEFHVTGTEYGLLVEGDQGQLSFQGTRYLDFKR